MSGRRPGDPPVLAVAGAVAAVALITGAILIMIWTVLAYRETTRTEIPDPNARTTPVLAGPVPLATGTGPAALPTERREWFGGSVD